MTHRALLLLSAITLAVAWQFPLGQQILYPLTMLATFAHEMGHGLAALLAGESFDQLRLHADGSGLALWHGTPGPVARALIAAGGLLGPTLAGITLLLARTARQSRVLLILGAILVAAVLLLWARNPFAIAFLLALAASLALAARFLPDLGVAFLTTTLALVLCLSWFTDLGYMFSAYADVDGTRHPSDSALIAQALGLPYWFWGGAVALVSLVTAGLGIAFASRRTD